MANLIQVEQDSDGLTQAIVALMKESFYRDYFKRGLQHATAEEIEQRIEEIGLRSLSPGYYGHGMYLCDLGASLESGVTYTAAELSRSDVRGLQSLARAKRIFEQEHPCCPKCGMRQESQFAPSCTRCGHKHGGGS